MARPTATKAVLTRCAAELSTELDSPGLKTDRKKAVIRQLTQVGLALARIEHRTAAKQEAKIKAAQPTPPASAERVEPKSDWDPGEDFVPTPGLLGTPAGQEPARNPNTPDVGAILGGKDTRPIEATRGATTLPPAPQGPVPDEDPDTMPRDPWAKDTIYPDREKHGIMNAMFQTALTPSLSWMADKALGALQQWAEGRPENSYETRLFSLYRWMEKHPEIRPHTVNLPAPRRVAHHELSPRQQRAAELREIYVNDPTMRPPEPDRRPIDTGFMPTYAPPQTAQTEKVYDAWVEPQPKPEKPII
jgi:hypothetical protein